MKRSGISVSPKGSNVLLRSQRCLGKCRQIEEARRADWRPPAPTVGDEKKKRLCQRRANLEKSKVKSWQRPTLPQNSAVPSAQEGLTAVFGMGTGVSPPPLSPGNLITILSCFCNTRYFLNKVRRRRCFA